MSFSPGPNTTLSTALAANGGLRRAMRFVLRGAGRLDLLLMLCAAGLGALVVGVPALRWAIKAARRRLPAVAGVEARRARGQLGAGRRAHGWTSASGRA